MPQESGLEYRMKLGPNPKPLPYGLEYRMKLGPRPKPKSGLEYGIKLGEVQQGSAAWRLCPAARRPFGLVRPGPSPSLSPR